MLNSSATVPDEAAVLLCAGVATEAGNPQPDAATRSFALKNVTATAVVYLGPHGVDSSTGFPWDATTDGPLSIDCEPGEELWGILASGGTDQTVKVLEQGR